MARRLLWLVLPGIVTVLGGTALAISMTGDNIASDLRVRAAAVLADPQLAWASVDVDMRDASISGTATDERMIEEAVRRVAAVDGVRSVASHVVLAEHVSPFPFEASVRDGAIAFSGGVPDERLRAEMLADYQGAADGLRLMSGAPEREAFSAAIRYGLDYLKEFDQGEFRLADLELTVVGRASNRESFATLGTLRRAGPPEGVRLARADITPPLADPYRLAARFENGELTLTGYVPDLRNADRVANAAGESVTVRSELQLASGAPPEFGDTARLLVENLVRLERGEALFEGGVSSLMGAPADADTAERVRLALSPRSVNVTLEPPRIADFRFAIEKSSAGTIVSGHVPDAASRERLEGLAGADTNAVQLGRGAPEGFARAFDIGLSAMPRLAEGRFAIDADGARLAGRATTLADFEAIETLLAEARSAGLNIDTAGLRLPLASPFTWSADKAADGEVTLSGFVPDRAARERIAAAAPKLGGDLSAPADGAPAGFERSALAGLEVLDQLDSGRLAFDGTVWTISGAAATAMQDFRARRVYAERGLAASGWQLAINLPAAPRAVALPVIEPYTWRAQKGRDGRISFAGFAPSATFQRFMLQRTGTSAADSTALGAGAPEGFPARAVAGLDALLLLDEGSLGFSAGNWTLSGRTATSAIRDRARSMLTTAPGAPDWRLAIEALDAPPVAAPYMFEAEKSASGVVLSGHLTSAELQRMVRSKATPLATDGTVLASGEPAGFVADLLAGLDALGALSEGRLGFDGSAWSLSGRAGSEAARLAAEAALDTAPHRAAGWRRDVQGPPPAVVAVAEPPPGIPPAEPQAAPAAEPAPEAQPPVAEPTTTTEPAPAVPPETQPATEPTPLPSEPATPPVAAAVEPTPPQSEPAPAVPEPAPATPQQEPPAPPMQVAALPPAAIAPPVEQEPEPLPERFLFEASRAADGSLQLAGLVPDETVRDALGEKASVDGLGIGEGLPDGFLASAEAGLIALGQLVEGRIGYGDGIWAVQGEAATASDRYALLAALGTAPGDRWRTDISVMPPLRFCQTRLATFTGRNAIVFRSGSDGITEDSMAAIDELAGYLGQCPEASVYVEGHTDADGAEDLNLALSVARAEAVVFALVDRGVAFERLYAVGYGESLPIADNDTQAGKQRNRRIAFQVAEGQ